MLNLLLNRYYLTNANRSVATAEIQARVHGLLEGAHIGELPASAAATSVRGKDAHEGRRKELQGLWMRQLTRDEEQTGCSGNFCHKH